MATIRKINGIKTSENADIIRVVFVNGWQCVVKKGDFKPGGLGVYFEIDSIHPIEEREGIFEKILL